MGKVRRYRQKYHLSKVGSSKSATDIATDIKTPSVVETKSNSIGENIFAGLQISYDSLTKTLGPDFDVRSIASTKSRKELKLEEQHLKKKVKKKLKHERFLRKLDVTQQAMRAAKERGKKKGRPVINNLNPPSDALPTWYSLVNSKYKSIDYKSKQKQKGIMKMEKRLRQQTNDTKQMRMILNDKKFKLNPGKTIIDFLKQKVSSNM